MKIKEFLIENGIFPNLKGFYPLIRAVEIVKARGRISITKALYPQLAEEFNMSASSIERNIRHIVEKIRPEQYAHYGFNFVPTNSELIYYFADGGFRWVV